MHVSFNLLKIRGYQPLYFEKINKKLIKSLFATAFTLFTFWNRNFIGHINDKFINYVWVLRTAGCLLSSPI